MSYDPRRRRRVYRRRHDPDPARRRSHRRHDPDPARRVYHRRGVSAMTALKAAAAGIIGAVAGAWVGGYLKDKVDVNINVMGKSINVADAAAGAAILAATPFAGRSSMIKTGLAALGGAMLAKSDPASVSPPGVGWAISPEGLGV
ncbi:MAG: hypothetical protein RXS42_09365 [Nitrososphaeria archaeon]